MMANKLKKAFTLAEVMVSMAIWATISTLTLVAFRGSHEYVEKIKLKNITLEFKNALNLTIKNPYYYSFDSDLTDLDEVTIENTKDGTTTSYKGVSKFKTLFLKELDVPQSNIVPCYMMMKDKTISMDNCYKGPNNVLWGIPDTDFTETNIIFAKNFSGSIFKYVPITVYPDVKNNLRLIDFNRFAIIFGVRRDGDITIINNVDCSIMQNRDYNQCKCKDYISAKKTER